MKTITTIQYQCEVCGGKFAHAEAASACERRPIRESKGVKVGDIVRITKGDGAGSDCQVTEVGVIEPSWGPRTYEHTEFVSGKVLDSWGNRMLTYDSYELIPALRR